LFIAPGWSVANQIDEESFFGDLETNRTRLLPGFRIEGGDVS